MKQVVLGIDIGGTYTKFGFVEESGVCLKDDFIKSDNYNDFDIFLEYLHTEIEESLKSLKEKVQIVGVGIGAANGNYYRGTIEHAPNLKWKGIVPIADKIKDYFSNVPVVVTNDANAAAIGEMMYGGAKGLQHFVVITLGTGLGSGIVVNGEVVYGNDGFAGELGHINVKHRGRQCKCGGKGCLETYVSATGIKRTVFKLMAESIMDSELRQLSFNEMTAKIIAEAARKGDKLAIKAFELTGRILGVKLADTVANTSPEAIFLFGGLAKSGELLFEPTRKHLEETLFPIYRGKVKLLASSLTEANAAVLGSAALVWHNLKNTKPMAATI